MDGSQVYEKALILPTIPCGGASACVDCCDKNASVATVLTARRSLHLWPRRPSTSPNPDANWQKISDHEELERTTANNWPENMRA